MNFIIADVDNMKDEVDVYAVHSCGIFSERSQFHICTVSIIPQHGSCFCLNMYNQVVTSLQVSPLYCCYCSYMYLILLENTLVFSTFYFFKNLGLTTSEGAMHIR